MALKIRISGVVGIDSNSKTPKSGPLIVSTPDALQAAIDAHPNEQDVEIDINSLGGSVYDGLAMFDILRTSGRNIKTNIIGGCHSIAVIILLAAPLKWRTSNPNSRSLIHKARTDPGGPVTTTELKNITDANAREEERIIQIYAERTKLTETQARALIEAEQTHTAQDLLKMGFISKINPYTTNSLTKKNRTMAQKNEAASLLERIGGFLTNAAKVLSPSNFMYKDAEGNDLFSTASEIDDLAVGMEVAFPDDTTGGTFDLPATETMPARVVTIEDFIVTEIEEIIASDLEAENAALKEQLAVAVNLIEEIKGQIGSTHQPANRKNTPSTATRTARQTASAAGTKEDIKNEIKANREAGFGFRGIHATGK